MLWHSMFQSQSKMVVAVGRMRLFMHSIRAIICFYISLMCFKLERNFKLYSFFFAFFDFDATLIDHPPPPQYRPLSISSSSTPSPSQAQESKPAQDNNCVNTDISSGSGTVQQTLALPGHDPGIIPSSLVSQQQQQQPLYHPFGSILEEEEELEESGPRDELWEISSSSGVNEFDDDGVGDEDTMWMHHHHHHQQRYHYHPHDEAMPSGDHLKTKLKTIHHRDGLDIIMPDVYVGLDLKPKLGRTSNPTSKPTSKAVTPPTTGSELGLVAESDCDAASLASPLICATDFAVYKEEYDYLVEVSNCNKKKVSKVVKDRSKPSSSVVRRHLTFSSSPKLTWVESGLNSLMTNSETLGNNEEEEEEEEDECDEFEGGRDSDDDIVPSVGSWETLSERSSEPPATTTCCRTSHSSSSSTTTTTSSSRSRWWKQLWPTTFSVSCTSKTSAKVSPTRLLSSCSERFLSCSGRVTAFDTRGVSTPGFDTKHHQHQNQHQHQHQHHHLRSKSFVTSTMNALGGNSSRPVSPRKSFDGGHHADHHHHQQARLSSTSKWFQKDFAHGHTSFTRRTSGSGSGTSSSSSSHHSNSAVDHLSVSNWNEFPAGLGAMNFQGCNLSVPSSASSSWDARGINGGEEDIIRRLVKGSRASGITVADLLMHEFDE